MFNKQVNTLKLACQFVGALVLVLVHFTTVSAQVATHFNRFQFLTESRNLDSAYYHAHALAGLNEPILNQLLHDAFAQKFLKAIPSTDTAFSIRILQKMYADTTSLPLKRALYPLYWYVEVARNLDNPVKVRSFVAGFMRAQAKVPEESGNRIDRYALLMYKQLKSKPVYSSLADTLFERTWKRLEHAVNGRYYQATDDRNLRAGRAYFRYIMATANHLKAEEAVVEKNAPALETYRKGASAFSPDENDRLAKPAYFYESVFLFDGEERDHFHQPYINYLAARKDSAAVLGVLTALAIADPGTIELLKTQYTKMPVAGQSFKTFWTKALNVNLKSAETFHLTSLDNQAFDYEKYKGKWVLIDFWGTWCVPCVQELPQFQKFYNELAKTNPDNIVVFTVACHEASEASVQAFRQKLAYTFPVVMGTDQLIKQFRVGEYPTKVLITPEGNRMKIPFGTAWTERVKTYLANHE